ncbi:glycosyltransferase family 4 protein [uncultured Roseivirga sp.]|uniref:glycosyltransferase family 4 protein n=1 Tax=uncultured Roseivirga sp. TaxID=543088 RepID=UPI002583C603|nr:glycosyltransferase family 4 protein [uncultured Roseivirga sp.]
MKSNLRIGFITALDPEDKRSWSGIYYRMYQSLNEQFEEVNALGPIRLNLVETVRMNLSILLFKVYHFFRYGSKVKSIHLSARSKAYSRFFERKLEYLNIDVLFAPVASLEIAYLRTNIPICYFSDTTFGQLWSYYHDEEGISSLVKKLGNRIEQLAIDNSTSQVFSSEWAAQYAVDFYGANSVFVTQLGANMDHDLSFNPRSLKDQINLLFIGVDWNRKGGTIVYQTFKSLLDKGYKVSLNVCGCIPPNEHPNMKVIPFLDKNVEEDVKRMRQLYEEADIYFMPTRAETYGIVFCEAAAFGLPVVSTNTGGVSSIVEDGKTGFLLPHYAVYNDYVEIIERLISNEELYIELSLNARRKFESQLNWSSWGKETRMILEHTAKGLTR